MEKPLIDDLTCLLASAHAKGCRLKDLAAKRAGTWDKRHFGPCDFVKVVQNRGTFDQHLAVIKDQRRNTCQRVDPPDLIGIAKNRSGVAIKGDPVVMQRNRHPPRRKAVELADKGHVALPPTVSPPISSVG